jgi:disulfide bond formation protein DsbB
MEHRKSNRRQNPISTAYGLISTYQSNSLTPPSFSSYPDRRRHVAEIFTASDAGAVSTLTTSDHEFSDAPTSRRTMPSILVWAPLLVALVALGGSLWLSIGMKLKACPLCFYQRTFVMGVVAVLGIGLLTGPRNRAVLNLLALPLTVGALGVAVFHVHLELTGKLECPAGVLGIGTSPQQSLAALIVLFVLVAVGVARSWKAGASHPAVVGAAVVLGLVLTWCAIASSPPMPPSPTRAYTTPLDICRPPFHSQ